MPLQKPNKTITLLTTQTITFFRHFENFLLKLLFNSQVVTEMAQEFSSSKTPQISEFYSQQRYTALKVDDFYANLIP